MIATVSNNVRLGPTLKDFSSLTFTFIFEVVLERSVVITKFINNSKAYYIFIFLKREIRYFINGN